MRIFLTGGTGFIGQALTQALLACGWQVIVLARKPDSPQARTLIEMGAQCVAGDITDRPSMLRGMTGADVVIHNAGMYEFGLTTEGKQRMRAVNVDGTENVLSLAFDLGIPRTVYVSTMMVWGETGPCPRDETFERQSPCRTCYEQTKSEAHAIAREYQQRGLPLIIVCPNAAIGPNDHSVYGYFLRLYLNHLMPPFCWSPDVITTLVHVDDLAQGILLAAEHGRVGETYILAGEPIRRRAFVALWNAQSGGFKIRFWLPLWLTSAACSLIEPLERLIGLPAFISRESAQAGAADLYYSNEKAKRDLGWMCRSAEHAWLDTIDGERELLAHRSRRDLVSWLKPLEIVHP